YVGLSHKDFALVNVPASVFSILMNIFFIYCMIFHQREHQQLKPPLNILQGILVGCNIMISVCTLLKVCMNALPCLHYVRTVVSKFVVYIMMTSVTSSFWQNVYYYCQITPAQSHCLCLKKNICTFIYCALLINGLIYLFGFSLYIALIVIIITNSKGIMLNFDTNYQALGIAVSWFLVMVMTFCFLILNLCGMSASCCATVIYLWKHLKNMEMNNTLSSPRFRRQIRMTIRSIETHAILHFICSMGLIGNSYISLCTQFVYDKEENVICTIVSVYALGTCIVQCIGQSLFRKQLVYSC
ncbi:hypothetical protein HF521_016541, partial [Silurus meridionalis]